MLQCVAVCCSVLQCVAVCCSVSQCVAVCSSVLRCVAVWLLRWGEDEEEGEIDDTGTCVAAWCRVL